jgi:predicted phage tail protein
MGGVVRAVTNAVKSVVKAVSKVISSVVSAVTSPFGMNIDVPDFDIGTDQSQAIQGVLINKDSAIAHIPVVYGARRVGGIRVFVSTNGSNNEYLYVAFVMAEGQINGFTKLVVDDNEVPLDSYAHGVVAAPTTGSYASKLSVQFFDGRNDQTASSLLQEAPGWDSDHKLSGIAYLALRFKWAGFNTTDAPDNNPYGGGVPNVQAEIQGKKILDITSIDPATYNTAYAADTITYSNNPVNVLADYLRNSRYGKGLDNGKFNWASWKSAAELCDQTVTYADASTSAAFTCDAVIDTSNSLMSNCKIILSGFRGIMPYQGGQYFLRIEHGGDNTDITATPSDPTTIFTVTADHIIGGITLDGESKQYKCNRCVVTYVDPQADYQPNEVVYPTEGSADDTAYLTADNGIRLEKRITLPTIANRSIAEQFAQVFVKRSRAQKFVTFNTTLATANTAVGDLIRVQSTTLGLDGIFRIMDMRIGSNGLIEISAMEHQSSAYAIAASGTDYVRPTINLPNPLTVTAPTGLTVSSGTQYNFISSGNVEIRRLRVAWTATADPFVSDYVLQFKRSSDGAYTTYTQTADTEAFISPVALGEVYDVRVCARNQLGRRSDFVTVLRHTVTETYVSADGGTTSSVDDAGSNTSVSGTGWST